MSTWKQYITHERTGTREYDVCDEATVIRCLITWAFMHRLTISAPMYGVILVEFPPGNYPSTVVEFHMEVP